MTTLRGAIWVKKVASMKLPFVGNVTRQQFSLFAMVFVASFSLLFGFHYFYAGIAALAFLVLGVGGFLFITSIDWSPKARTVHAAFVTSWILVVLLW